MSKTVYFLFTRKESQNYFVIAIKHVASGNPNYLSKLLGGGGKL